MFMGIIVNALNVCPVFSTFEVADFLVPINLSLQNCDS